MSKYANEVDAIPSGTHVWFPDAECGAIVQGTSIDRVMIKWQTMFGGYVTGNIRHHDFEKCATIFESEQNA